MAETILLRPEQAAESLGVSRARVYQLIAAGEIPVVKLGPKITRISIEALRAYAASKERRIRRPRVGQSTTRGRRNG